jgi:hypothetical protein
MQVQMQMLVSENFRLCHCLSILAGNLNSDVFSVKKTSKSGTWFSFTEPTSTKEEGLESATTFRPVHFDRIEEASTLIKNVTKAQKGTLNPSAKVGMDDDIPLEDNIVISTEKSYLSLDQVDDMEKPLETLPHEVLGLYTTTPRTSLTTTIVNEHLTITTQDTADSIKTQAQHQSSLDHQSVSALSHEESNESQLLVARADKLEASEGFISSLQTIMQKITTKVQRESELVDESDFNIHTSSAASESDVNEATIQTPGVDVSQAT